MNPNTTSEAESLRSDIEMTRRRMDDTMDALGERLHGRHLLDEVIGFFRHDDSDTGAASRLKEKISESAGNAGRAVARTVKEHPLPVLAAAAGAAWLAYALTRNRNRDNSYASQFTEPGEIESEEPYDPDTHYDRPIEYPSGTMAKMGAESGSKLEDLKNTVQEKAAATADQMKEKFSAFSERAAEMGSRVQARTQAAYQRTRDQVARTADEHPLELGLGCLALGVIAGLALPTPAPVHRVAGPAVDRLRNRTKDTGREFLEKGKRVVRAATDAARREAEAQGLTIEQLRARAASGATSNPSPVDGLPGPVAEPDSGPMPA